MIKHCNNCKHGNLSISDTIHSDCTTKCLNWEPEDTTGCKFKVGDTVFDINNGVCRLTDIYEGSIKLIDDKDGLIFYRLLDGKQSEENAAAHLFTLEEARRMWPDCGCLKKKKVKKQLAGWLVLIDNGAAVIASTKERSLEFCKDWGVEEPTRHVAIEYIVEEWI